MNSQKKAPEATGPNALMRANVVSVFNERNADRRRAAVGQLYAADATLYEPEAVAIGWDAISQAVGKLLASLPPDFVFTVVADAVGHNGAARLFWRASPPGGPVAATGTDFAFIEGDKIKRLYVFVDSAPR
jgi:SnoaL-like domain